MGTLHAVNESAQTPFHSAVRNEFEWAIKFFQWKMTFDEYMSAYLHDTSHREKVRPFLDSVCEDLRMQYLNIDLVGLVYEFLGYARIKTTQSNARKGIRQPSTSKKQRR